MDPGHAVLGVGFDHLAAEAGTGLVLRNAEAVGKFPFDQVAAHVRDLRRLRGNPGGRIVPRLNSVQIGRTTHIERRAYPDLPRLSRRAAGSPRRTSSRPRRCPPSSGSAGAAPYSDPRTGTGSGDAAAGIR